MRRAVRFSFAALALMAALAGTASARVGGDSPYTKSQTYNGALRYLRVELGYEITEKDADAAYLIFQYVPPGARDKSSTGTLEIVETEKGVHVYVELPKMPEYHELLLRDGLLKKLREEYGAPPKKAPAPSEPPKAAPPKPTQG
jgi:hypothetical protein